MTTPLHHRAVVLLLLLGCTFIGLPVNVFSQSETVPNATAVDNSIIETPSSSDMLVSEADIKDTYSREVLPNNDVFNDFVVGPGKFELELEPGQSRTVELMVTNRMGSTKRFKFEIEDTAGSSNGSSAVNLLGSEQGPYTLRDYIQISAMEFELEHGVKARIPVTVSLPPDAEPGGRYGSVVLSTVTRDADLDPAGDAAPASAIISRIGTLFFVTTPGEIERSGELQAFSTISNKMFYGKGPVDFNLVYENTGSVHLNPYGEIRIFNMLGDEVGFLELEPWFAMPNSLRLREISWDRELMMGRYTAKALINRGYDNVIDEKQVVFYVIPWKIIVMVFVSLVFLFTIIKLLFSRFEFKRKS